LSLSDIHKKKRRKNFVLLALIFAWCALIWAITMVKMAHAEDLSLDDVLIEIEMEAEADAVAEDDLVDSLVVESGSFENSSFLSDPGKFLSGREAHQEFIEAQPALWWENWEEKIDPEK